MLKIRAGLRSARRVPRTSGFFTTTGRIIQTTVRPRMTTIRTAAGAALLLMVMAAGLNCGGGSDAFPELTPFPSATAERLHAIRDKIAAVRGLPARTEIEGGVITTEGLQAYSAG